MTPGEVVGIVTEEAKVVGAARTAMDEVARVGKEEVLLLDLLADFLDEVTVELLKCEKLPDGLAMAVTPAETDEATLVMTALELEEITTGAEVGTGAVGAEEDEATVPEPLAASQTAGPGIV
jgi:hypothetical protein